MPGDGRQGPESAMSLGGVGAGQIVPQGVQAVATVGHGPDEPCSLTFIFCDEIDMPPDGCLAGGLADEA